MKLSKILAPLLALCLFASTACASTFIDAHGNEIQLDDSLEAYAAVTLVGANDAARQGETNLGDLWTDALRWFAVSGEINAAFDEDDVKAGNDHIAVDADHVVALWNGGNLRADIAEGTFGAEALAEVLPFPNKVAVVYMSGAQLLEALEAASQALPYTAETADACASLMQVSGLTYTVDTAKAYDALEAECYGKIRGLESQLDLMADHRNNVIRMNRIAKTALDIFDDILNKPKLKKQDIEFIVERIDVYDDHIDIQLKSDIDALLHVSATQAIEQAAGDESALVRQVRNHKKDERLINSVRCGDMMDIQSVPA